MIVTFSTEEGLGAKIRCGGVSCRGVTPSDRWEWNADRTAGPKETLYRTVGEIRRTNSAGGGRSTED